jgi:molybdenum cofactor cytidylyltransferase
MFTTGLVLAAGRSRHLGQPQQVLASARGCGFDQLMVALGDGGDAMRSTIDLTGLDVVENAQFASGCSSSIVAALSSVDERAEALVLLLDDQPEVEPIVVHRLRTICEAGVASIGVCHYADGRGHPFWFARSTFGALDGLYGDNAVWKLVGSGRWPVCDVAIDGVMSEPA